MTHKTKKLFGLALALTFAGGMAAFGQADSDSDTIEVKATILNPITVTGVDDLDFGHVITGTEETINAKEHEEAGHFTVDATANEPVVLNFSAPSNLGDPEVIFKDGQHAYHLGGTDQTEATLESHLNEHTVTPTVDEFGVWIGGTLEVTSEADPGVYEADFTLSVEYVN